MQLPEVQYSTFKAGRKLRNTKGYQEINENPSEMKNLQDIALII